ncbi:MAG: hypothetical protein JWO84_33 [Parcubacteria group bacterium]|nr:hypothetical protein [Parcubacteria group bacterium]
MWQDWINGFLGIWLVLLAALGLAGNTLVFLAGLAVAVAGFWGAWRDHAALQNDVKYRRDAGLYSE